MGKAAILRQQNPLSARGIKAERRKLYRSPAAGAREKLHFQKFLTQTAQRSKLRVSRDHDIECRRIFLRAQRIQCSLDMSEAADRDDHYGHRRLWELRAVCP